MQIIIGIIIIAGGILYSCYIYRKKTTNISQARFMQTSTIKDAVELIGSMLGVDPSYRHYVELKGTIHCEEALRAPYSERKAAYYTSRCYSVTEEKRTERDQNGNTTTRRVKHENELSSENREAVAYLTDSSGTTPVYVNFSSFGGGLELMQGCDRFERSGSEWLRNSSFGFSYNTRSGEDFLGYRLKEEFFPDESTVYALGELYQADGKYYIEAAHASKNPSVFTYRSEDDFVNNTNKEKISAMVIGGVATLIGLFLIFYR